MQTTITINGNTITCDESLVGLIVAQMCGTAAPATTTKPTTKKATTKKAPTSKKAVISKKAEKPITPADARGVQWWDEFQSPTTTVTITKNTVQVKVKRGYATHWHDTLRHSGFKWSKKGFWWADMDAKKRQALAERNRANDAATAGMTKEERREYWRNRNAARSSK